MQNFAKNCKKIQQHDQNVQNAQKYAQNCVQTKKIRTTGKMSTDCVTRFLLLCPGIRHQAYGSRHQAPGKRPQANLWAALQLMSDNCGLWALLQQRLKPKFVVVYFVRA